MGGDRLHLGTDTTHMHPMGDAAGSSSLLQGDPLFPLTRRARRGRREHILAVYGARLGAAAE